MAETLKNDQEVRLLFNVKAQSWNNKYRANGPLASRVSAFSEYLTRLIGPTGTVLDFGCGSGAISATLGSLGYGVTACDVADKMIAAGKRTYPEGRIEWLLLPPDWEELPFEGDMFDAVVASSVFEYLSDIENALKECRRILKSTGKLIISVPNPAHPLRKLERLIRPLAFFAEGSSLLNVFPKVGSYLTYLRVSRVRLSIDEWCEHAKSARLRLVRLSDMESTHAPNKALMYLAFERTR